MNDTNWILLAAAALLIGLGLGWYLRHLTMRATGAEAETKVAAAQSDAAAARSEAAGARAEIAAARADVAQAQAEAERANAGAERARAEIARAHEVVARAQAQVARLESTITTVEVERDAAIEQAEKLRTDRETMLNAYQSLSAAALDRQAKTAEEVATQRFTATERLMAPMRESLDKLQARLVEIEKERATLASDMANQVRAVQATGEQVRKETSALVSALRRPQVRGTWGELQLSRVVEIAGMVEYCDFVLQETSSTDERVIRPDLRVNLAGGKFVYVDSKVPLAAFLDAQEAGTDDTREHALARFARHVKDHVDLLSRKEYWKADAGTPEFVVLFIPSEALASTALEQNPALIEYAAGKNIVLATPTTLIAMLRTIAYSWTQSVLADSAREVSTVGRELYDRLATMGSHLDRVGRSLETSVKAYNDAIGSLESRVLVSARRFRDLKVTDAELETPHQVTLSPRPIAAPELVEDAVNVTPLIGRVKRGGEASDEMPVVASVWDVASVS